MADLRILSLGAGVQSSTLAMLIEQGKVPMVDAGIFANVGAEPDEVINWLYWLKSKVSYPIYIVQDRNLKKDLIDFTLGKYHKIRIPFHTLNESGKKGMNRRSCTSEYKILPIVKKVREMLGLKKGEKRKKGTEVEMLMGISRDEITRMRTNQIKYIKNQYPLVDMGWTRQKCKDWFEENYKLTPPRSACTFCPFHSNEEWLKIKENKKEWEEVVKLEKSLTNNQQLKKVGYNDKAYFTNKCIPIDQVDFKETTDQLDLFENDCTGLCGS